MAFPTPPNPNQPIPNNPFYYPPTNRLEGGDQGLVTIGLGLTITPEGVLNATGLGPVSAVTNLVAGTGLAVDNNTGNVLITNTGVVTLNPGSGIAISGSNGNYTITNTLPATPTSGTVYQIDAGTGLSGGTITTSGTIALTNTGVAPATYTNPTITVDAQGRITFAAPGSPGSLISGTYPIQVAGGILVSIADATTGNPGAVQLENSTTSTSLTKAATANSVKVAYDVAQAASGSSSTALAVANSAQAAANAAQISANTAQSTANAALPATGGTMTGPIVFAPGQTFPGTSVPDASNSVKGIVQIGTNIQVSGGVISILNSSTTQSGLVQLNNSTNSTSTTEALTANAGNVLQQQINALAVSSNLTLAGTIDASTGFMVTVTTEGAANGFVVGSPLPTAVPANDDYFAIVTVAGTMTPPGGSAQVCHVGDWWLSNGTVWQFLDVAPPVPVIAEATPNSFGTILGYTDNTDTDFNVSLGRCALNAASTAGFANVAVGIAAGYGVTTGYGNTLIGPGTGCAIADGNVNTALGIGALSGVTSGFANLGVGICSGCAFTVESGNAILGGYYGDPGDINTLVLSDGPGNLKAKFDGSGALSFDGTAYGTAGQVLSSNGAGAKPTWITAAAPANATPTVAGIILGCTTATNAALGCNSLLAGGGTCNIAIGSDSLKATTTGSKNVAVGTLGLASLTTGLDNTAIGYGALALSVSGSSNTAVGSSAMGLANVTGNGNVAFGGLTLANLTSAIGNSGYGVLAGCALSTGNFNTLLGYATGCNLTTGCWNVAIGNSVQVASATGSCQLAIGTPTFNWLTGTSTGAIKPGAGIIDCANSCGTAGQVLMSDGSNAICWGTAGGASAATPTVAGIVLGCTTATNSALGCSALAVNTGSNNTATGVTALCANTTGSCNTANGVGALFSNTTASGNTATGFCSLRANTTGFWTTATGFCALASNTTGNFNVANGANALLCNTAGSCNVAVGFFALQFTTGSANVAVGASSGCGITSGSGNIAFGGVTSGGSYSPVFSATTENNRIVMGSNAVTNAYIQVAWTVVSDARDKTNVTALPVGLDFVNQLNPVSFQFKESRECDTATGPVRYGFLAQEVLEAEGENPVIVDTEVPEKLKITNDHMNAVLVKAIQELSEQNKALEARIAQLEANG
jgi:hypothetical protein